MPPTSRRSGGEIDETGARWSFQHRRPRPFIVLSLSSGYTPSYSDLAGVGDPDLGVKERSGRCLWTSHRSDDSAFRGLTPASERHERRMRSLRQARRMRPLREDHGSVPLRARRPRPHRSHRVLSSERPPPPPREEQDMMEIRPQNGLRRTPKSGR